ncbi:MAG: glycoside hydrolase 100 family protein [Thermostichales cyanobacterium HHBFW_bins_127]
MTSTVEHEHLERAKHLLYDQAMVHFQGQPIGTVAAIPQKKWVMSNHHAQIVPPPDLNYGEVFIRDNVLSMICFLLDGRADIVRNFLSACLQLQSWDPRTRGIFPTSFYVEGEQLIADYGQRAIGRVVSVDATLWWPILLNMYVQKTQDWDWIYQDGVQTGLKNMLGLILQPSFREIPTLHVPDGSFMIDRPLDVWGSPLEVQVLLYGALLSAAHLLRDGEREGLQAVERAIRLRRYLHKHYWLNRQIVQTLRRRPTDQYGDDVVNEYNIRTETIPHWLQSWLGTRGGFLIGNIRTGRPDFRFFTLGNCLAAIFDILTQSQQRALFNLILHNQKDLVGEMPMRICHPPLDDFDWQNKTGYDPKNRPWCYHNAGHWPCLLPFLVMAVLRHQHRFLDLRYTQTYLPMQELLKRAYNLQMSRLPEEKWAEYFDGPTGFWMGQQARLYQSWTIAALLLVHRLLMQSPADSTILDLVPLKKLWAKYGSLKK